MEPREPQTLTPSPADRPLKEQTTAEKYRAAAVELYGISEHEASVYIKEPEDGNGWDEQGDALAIVFNEADCQNTRRTRGLCHGHYQTMRALDLFCCAGGASAGLTRAGFTVTGVDIDPQPRYPWKFIQADALALDPEWIADNFDFVWASPPCQFATAYKRKKVAGRDWVRESPNLIPGTRELLDRTGLMYVIENVDQKQVRAELRDPVRLCGSHFGLDVQRHRLFETNGWELPQPRCDHSKWTPRFPPAGNRTNLRKTCEIGAWRIPMETQYAAMSGLEWMKREELSQAIPPAYGEYIGLAARSALQDHSKA